MLERGLWGGGFVMAVAFLAAPASCLQGDLRSGDQTSIASLGNETMEPASGSQTNQPNQTLSDEVVLAPQVGAGSHPRVIQLANGSFLAATTSVANGNTSLIISHSADSAVTFTDVGVLASSHHDLGEPSLLELKATSGQTTPTILAAYHDNTTDSSGAVTQYQLAVAVSSDGGGSWQSRGTVASKAAPNGYWEPFLRQSSNGDVHIYYSLDNSSTDQDILRRVSTDVGATWGDPITAAGASTTSLLGSVSVVPASVGGKNVLLLVCATNRDGPQQLISFVSSDEGASWSGRQLVYQSPNNRNASQAYTLPGNQGGVAIVFATDEDNSDTTPLAHPSVKMITAPAASSGNFIWSTATSLSPASSFWPAISALTDGQALVSYDRGEPLARRVALPAGL